ncbi:MAG: glycosyltransferase [Erythrobacter sp.]
MLTSTLPRFQGDMQANFVGEQAEAWLSARPDAQITILAPHDIKAPQREQRDRLTIERFSYMWPARAQTLAYPAIMPNIRRNPLIGLQVPGFLFAQARYAKKLMEKERFDCIYAHWVMPQGLVARWLSQRTGVPYILQTHSSDLSVLLKAGGAGRRLAQNLLRDASRFFCVNSGQLDIALGILPEADWGTFRSKSAVLPMGVADLTPAKSNSDGADIGTIGRLSRKKGLDFLIAAAEELAAQGERPRIAIAGDGEEAAALKAAVNHSAVEFSGFVSGAEKDAFLAACKRFAFPAKAADGDVEGLPVALLEALMRGQPVLASRDTNIELLPEWPQIKDDVVFVPDPEDIGALAQGLKILLARAPGSAKRSADIVGRYRWERLIEEYLAPIEAEITVG